MIGQRFFSKGNKVLQPQVGQVMAPQPGQFAQPMPTATPQGYVPVAPAVQGYAQAQPMMVQQGTMQPIAQPMMVQPVVNQPSQAPQMANPAAAMPQPAESQVTVGDSSIDPSKRSGMDMLTHLSQRSSQGLMKAANKAGQLQLPYIDTEHLLYGLLFDGQFFTFLKDLGISAVTIQHSLETNFQNGNYQGQPQFSPRVKKVLELSYAFSQQVNANFINPEHLLLGLIEEGEGIAAQMLTANNVTSQMVRDAAVKDQQVQHDQAAVAEGGEKKPTLTDFTVDFTAKAKEGKLDPVVGRSNEIERTIHILSRRTKNNAALVGEAGTGKTAIVEGLAQRIAQGTVPPDLAHKRLLGLDLMSLVAGASKRGEFEERLKLIIKEVTAANGEIILFIDEMHNIIGTGGGGEGSMDAGNILKPYLARGEIQVIGTDTTAEYHRYIEKDPALERRFQTVTIPEPSQDEAIEMLHGLRNKYEAYHKVKISDEALEAAVKLSARYIGDRFLPDKAIDLIDEASASKRLPAISLPEEIKSMQTQVARIEHDRQEAVKSNNKAKQIQTQKDLEAVNAKMTDLAQRFNRMKGTQTNIVEPSDLEEIVARWTGIPIQKLTESESEKLLNMEERIHKRLIGQEGAVSAVTEAVRRGRSGLKAAKRPIGSFLFLGPTGTGKTELAKTLAETLFGSEDLMIRLDMTEYMEKHEVAKLIGAPPGYVGYEEGGQLTEAVRRKPYSVVLLDEVEKAHPDVFNILIQILEDGRLTDNKGRTVSFKNVVLICTSNLGSQIIANEDLTGVTVQNIQSLGGKKDAASSGKDVDNSAKIEKDSPKAQSGETPNEKWVRVTATLMEELKKFFRPELLNRFDDMIVFRPISRDDMIKITDIQLANTMKLLQEQNISMEVSDAAKKHLSEIGYDPQYGARPLRRLISQQVENPVSLLMIKGEIKPSDTVLVNFQNGEFIFSRKPRDNEQGKTDISQQAAGVVVNPAGNILSTEQERMPGSSVPGQVAVIAIAQQGVAQVPPQYAPQVGPDTNPADLYATQVTDPSQAALQTMMPDLNQLFDPQMAAAPVDPTLQTGMIPVEQPQAPGDPSAFFENQKAFMAEQADASPSGTDTV